MCASQSLIFFSLLFAELEEGIRSLPKALLDLVLEKFLFLCTRLMFRHDLDLGPHNLYGLGCHARKSKRLKLKDCEGGWCELCRTSLCVCDADELFCELHEIYDYCVQCTRSCAKGHFIWGSDTCRLFDVPGPWNKQLCFHCARTSRPRHRVNYFIGLKGSVGKEGTNLSRLVTVAGRGWSTPPSGEAEPAIFTWIPAC